MQGYGSVESFMDMTSISDVSVRPLNMFDNNGKLNIFDFDYVFLMSPSAKPFLGPGL